jgi:hypothetical protein
MQHDVKPESQISGSRKDSLLMQRLGKHVPLATNRHAKKVGGRHRQQGDLISLLLLFQNKQSSLKMAD